MAEKKRTRLRICELNPHLLCALCGGYLIDATTIVECLHSFCKTCILRYLETSNYCPICEVLIHKKRPWQNIRLDHTLQNAVYKLVPGLFKREMQRRRDFYEKNPPPGGKEMEQVHSAPERIIFSEDEKFSVSLEFSPNGRAVQVENDKAVSLSPHRDKRFLLCPANVCIGHLKKFVRLKYTLPECYQIDLFYSDEPLEDTYTLMDVAYIYSWRRENVLMLYYSFYQRPRKRRRVTASATATSQDHAASSSSAAGRLKAAKTGPSSNSASSSTTTAPNTNSTTSTVTIVEASADGGGGGDGGVDGGGVSESQGTKTTVSLSIPVTTSASGVPVSVSLSLPLPAAATSRSSAVVLDAQNGGGGGAGGSSSNSGGGDGTVMEFDDDDDDDDDERPLIIVTDTPAASANPASSSSSSSAAAANNSAHPTDVGFPESESSGVTIISHHKMLGSKGSSVGNDGDGGRGGDGDGVVVDDDDGGGGGEDATDGFAEPAPVPPLAAATTTATTASSEGLVLLSPRHTAVSANNSVISFVSSVAVGEGDVGGGANNNNNNNNNNNKLSATVCYSATTIPALCPKADTGSVSVGTSVCTAFLPPLPHPLSSPSAGQEAVGSFKDPSPHPLPPPKDQQTRSSSQQQQPTRPSPASPLPSEPSTRSTSSSTTTWKASSAETSPAKGAPRPQKSSPLGVVAKQPTPSKERGHPKETASESAAGHATTKVVCSPKDAAKSSEPAEERPCTKREAAQGKKVAASGNEQQQQQQQPHQPHQHHQQQQQSWQSKEKTRAKEGSPGHSKAESPRGESSPRQKDASRSAAVTSTPSASHCQKKEAPGKAPDSSRAAVPSVKGSSSSSSSSASGSKSSISSGSKSGSGASVSSSSSKSGSSKSGSSPSSSSSKGESGRDKGTSSQQDGSKKDEPPIPPVKVTARIVNSQSSASSSNVSSNSSSSPSSASPSSMGIFERIYSVTSNCTASGIKSIFKTTAIVPAASARRMSDVSGLSPMPAGGISERRASTGGSSSAKLASSGPDKHHKCSADDKHSASASHHNNNRSSLDALSHLGQHQQHHQHQRKLNSPSSSSSKSAPSSSSAHANNNNTANNKTLSAGADPAKDSARSPGVKTVLSISSDAKRPRSAHTSTSPTAVVITTSSSGKRGTSDSAGASPIPEKRRSMSYVSSPVAGDGKSGGGQSSPLGSSARSHVVGLKLTVDTAAIRDAAVDGSGGRVNVSRHNSKSPSSDNSSSSSSRHSSSKTTSAGPAVITGDLRVKLPKCSIHDQTSKVAASSAGQPTADQQGGGRGDDSGVGVGTSSSSSQASSSVCDPNHGYIPNFLGVVTTSKQLHSKLGGGDEGKKKITETHGSGGVHDIQSNNNSSSSSSNNSNSYSATRNPCATHKSPSAAIPVSPDGASKKDDVPEIRESRESLASHSSVPASSASNSSGSSSMPGSNTTTEGDGSATIKQSRTSVRASPEHRPGSGQCAVDTKQEKTCVKHGVSASAGAKTEVSVSSGGSIAGVKRPHCSIAGTSSSPSSAGSHHNNNAHVVQQRSANNTTANTTSTTDAITNSNNSVGSVTTFTTTTSVGQSVDSRQVHTTNRQAPVHSKSTDGRPQTTSKRSSDDHHKATRSAESVDVRTNYTSSNTTTKVHHSSAAQLRIPNVGGGSSDPSAAKKARLSSPGSAHFSMSPPIVPTILSSSSAGSGNTFRSSADAQRSSPAAVSSAPVSLPPTATTTAAAFTPRSAVNSGAMRGGNKIRATRAQAGKGLAPGQRVDSLLFRATNRLAAAYCTSADGRPLASVLSMPSAVRAPGDHHKAVRTPDSMDSRMSFINKTFGGGKSSKETCVNPAASRGMAGGGEISFSTRHILSPAFHSSLGAAVAVSRGGGGVNVVASSASSGINSNKRDSISSSSPGRGGVNLSPSSAHARSSGSSPSMGRKMSGGSSSSTTAVKQLSHNSSPSSSAVKTVVSSIATKDRNHTTGQACDLSKRPSSSSATGSSSNRRDGLANGSMKLDIPRLSSTGSTSSGSRDSVFASDPESSPTPPPKFSDINRNPIKLDSGSKLCRKDVWMPAENGGRRSTGSVGSPSSLGSGPGSPLESERSPARDARRPSDSELLMSQRWHGLPHPHLLTIPHPRDPAAAAVVAAALYNGHFKIPPTAKYLPLAPEHVVRSASPEPMPLDYSTTSTSSSSSK